MKHSKLKLMYSGKSKSLYETENKDAWLVEFRDDLTAFNGEKHEKMAQKGAINAQINAHLMQLLAKEGIPTHFIQQLSDHESLVKRLQMIPLESVVRNVAAGSLCRRLGLSLGIALNPPVYELFYKNDALGDPMVNEDHALVFKWATESQLKQMRELSLRINKILLEVFSKIGLVLVDAKFEFGILGDQLYLGDEITPDSCRLWDKNTQKVMDKDRFRQNLGGVIEAYQEVAHRLMS